MYSYLTIKVETELDTEIQRRQTSTWARLLFICKQDPTKILFTHMYYLLKLITENYEHVLCIALKLLQTILKTHNSCLFGKGFTHNS